MGGGVMAQGYTRPEDAYIEKWYGRIPIDEIAERLNRTPKGIHQRVMRLKTGRVRPGETSYLAKFLPPEMDKVIRPPAFYFVNRKSSIESAAEHPTPSVLPGYTEAPHYAKRIPNSFKRYTEEDIETLLEMLIEGKTVSEISKRLGRSQKAISVYIHTHNLKP